MFHDVHKAIWNVMKVLVVETIVVRKKLILILFLVSRVAIHVAHNLTAQFADKRHLFSHWIPSRISSERDSAYTEEGTFPSTISLYAWRR